MMSSKEIDKQAVTEESSNGIPASKSEIDLVVKLEALGDVVAALVSPRNMKRDIIGRVINKRTTDNMSKLLLIAKESTKYTEPKTLDQKDVPSQQPTSVNNAEELPFKAASRQSLMLCSLNDIVRYETFLTLQASSLCRTESISSLDPERPKSRARIDLV